MINSPFPSFLLQHRNIVTFTSPRFFPLTFSWLFYLPPCLQYHPLLIELFLFSWSPIQLSLSIPFHSRISVLLLHYLCGKIPVFINLPANPPLSQMLALKLPSDSLRISSPDPPLSQSSSILSIFNNAPPTTLLPVGPFTSWSLAPTISKL